MPENGSRRGAVELGTILMVVAFAVIGGFMYWLNGEAAIEKALKLVEEVEVVEEENTTATDVVSDALRLGGAEFEGQEIRLSSFIVASVLGSQGFWLDVPGGSPFLVSMSADVLAEGLSISGGIMATVIGTVNPMNDSTLSAWEATGTIGDNDRLVAEFATHFIEATDIRVSVGGGAGN